MDLFPAGNSSTAQRRRPGTFVVPPLGGRSQVALVFLEAPGAAPSTHSEAAWARSACDNVPTPVPVTRDNLAHFFPVPPKVRRLRAAVGNLPLPGHLTTGMRHATYGAA